MAAQITSLTYDTYAEGHAQKVRKVVLAWTSATGGTVTVNIPRMRGFLVKAVTNPGAAAPSENYDIALTDSDGGDILGNCDGSLANRHTSNTETVYFFVKESTGTTALAAHPIVDGVVTVSITNAGDEKNGTLALYWLGD